MDSERIAALVIKNGDIYEDVLGPKYATIKAWWADQTPSKHVFLPAYRRESKMPTKPTSRASGAAAPAATSPTPTSSIYAPRVFRRSRRPRSAFSFCARTATTTWFTTISYWADIQAMTAFTKGEPTKVHHLDRDPEF